MDIKCNLIEVSDKLKFPFNNLKSDDTTDASIPQNLIIQVPARPKLKPQNYSLKLPDKLKSILNNFSSAKWKELMSRNTHEFCTESGVNQLIRNFNDFIILMSDKIDSRDDVGYILESCKRLSIKPHKTTYIPYYASTEFMEEIKSKVLDAFLSSINDQNDTRISWDLESVDLDPYSRNGGFKAYIEKGNNGTIVKTVLNRRSWWSIQEKSEDSYTTSNFIWTQWLKPTIISSLPTSPTSTPLSPFYNKLESTSSLSNKKDLFLNLSAYYKCTQEDSSDCMPLTFLIEGGTSSQGWKDFKQYFTMVGAMGEDAKWIWKPGENSNRGQNIWVVDKLESVQGYVQGRKSWIVQKYIHNPLLINRRKFDIRCFGLLSGVNGKHQGYFYQDGYLRTAWKEFSGEDVEDLFIHLTNDAIQK
jgi:hypothetical protein